MKMFCAQCQEAARNVGCDTRGVCGKPAATANLQDVLIYSARALSVALHLLHTKINRPDTENADFPDQTEIDTITIECGREICRALFTTVTNVSFDDNRIVETIFEILRSKATILRRLQEYQLRDLPSAVTWAPADGDVDALHAMEPTASMLSDTNEDTRALRQLATFGLKGIAAYSDHALVLGYEDVEQYGEFARILAGTLTETDGGALTQLVLDTGSLAVRAMELLDKANTESYGNPEITQVNIGVRDRPGILISGHDLRDMYELLEQTKGSGVDVYTHGEMLPANYYPAFKKYAHFVGNYGNSWWLQDKEFTSFNGAILMTTNCLTPPKDAYMDRLFTTGLVSFPGVKHIKDRKGSQAKDFSPVIEVAKHCSSPIELERGTITGGFAHAQVTALVDTVVDAVKSGAIKKFVVMAGCDGRHKSRSHFTAVAMGLPKDTVILTAGCAKFRYNKLDLGSIGGIPRVLDAGQCNDSYSLAVIALKLKEIFKLDDINDLPIDFDIAWYEQKALTVLLALLALGFKGVRIGPTLPAFLSPEVTRILVDTFGLSLIGTVEEDIAAITAS